ncbi:hypothetical protein [Sulfitobacter sp. SK011]|uniref:hypothetical protein n=1 Tax=Sulfitobacter sp. SK011 TaxID=1389004 RepID=UPI0013B3EB23|nr:hypothetical protein [Sulfitobacter sp. SK011]
MRSYEAARSLFSFLAFMAWSVVVVGVIVALIGAAGASQYGGSGAGLLAMVPGIGIGITGLILVAFVQMGRATVDTAEYTQQMLSISRDQLEVSKQGLKLHGAVPQTFAAAAQKEFAPDPKSSFADSATPSEEDPELAKSQLIRLQKAESTEEIIDYRGEKIRVEGGKYFVGKIGFFEFGSAKRHIEKMENVSSSLEPKQSP